MDHVGFHQIDSFRDSHTSVETFGLPQGAPRSGDVEHVVAGGGADESRFRSPDHEVVGMSETLGDFAVNLLLRVSRTLRVQHLLHVSDVAGGRGAGDALVQRHEKSGHQSRRRSCP